MSKCFRTVIVAAAAVDAARSSDAGQGAGANFTAAASAAGTAPATHFVDAWVMDDDEALAMSAFGTVIAGDPYAALASMNLQVIRPIAPPIP